jgi:hypothetical protein
VEPDSDRYAAVVISSGVLTTLLGLLSVLVGVVDLLVVSNVRTLLPQDPSLNEPFVVFRAAGFAVALFGITQLTDAIGLLMRRRAAIYLGLALSLVGAAFWALITVYLVGQPRADPGFDGLSPPFDGVSIASYLAAFSAATYLVVLGLLVAAQRWGRPVRGLVH